MHQGDVFDFIMYFFYDVSKSWGKFKSVYPIRIELMYLWHKLSTDICKLPSSNKLYLLLFIKELFI